MEAPAYEVEATRLSVKISHTAKYLLPLAIIIFLVTGVILVGIASPSEAAATGAVGTVILAIAYRKFNWNMMRESLLVTLKLSSMLFAILLAASVFGRILDLSGASRGLVDYLTTVPVSPVILIALMQLVIVILGMFVDTPALMIIFIPIFMPIVTGLGFDPVWFCAIFLINCVLGGLTPPVGMWLFVMAGTTTNTTLEDCIKAAVPYICLMLVVMVLIFIFPAIAIWLPGLMSK